LPEDRERDLLEMRAASSLGWRFFQLHGSTEAAFPSEEKAKELAMGLDEKAALDEILLNLQAFFALNNDMRKASEQSRAVFRCSNTWRRPSD